MPAPYGYGCTAWGDEFTILLEDIEDISDALRIVGRVQEELRLPLS
jgi:hypothetical protein